MVRPEVPKVAGDQDLYSAHLGYRSSVDLLECRHFTGFHDIAARIKVPSLVKRICEKSRTYRHPS